MPPQILVGFSTTNKFMSRVIRWITRGKASHSWVRYWDATLQQYMVLQAELRGYETIPWRRWLTKNLLVAAYAPREGLDLLEGVRFISQYLGVDYDLRSAIWTGLKRWFKKRLRRPASSPSTLMCSEAVCRMLQNGQVSCVADLNPELVSPKELMERLSKSSDFTQVSEESLRLVA
jgi:hypothetical protein